MESSITKTLMMEPSFDRREGGVVGSRFVDDGKLGANVVGSVGKVHAVNLVVDLARGALAESDCSMVEFAEKEGEFEFGDLVWGEVKNHTWLPGQIVNPSASTDEAMKVMKHVKKDGFLIAFFGGRKCAFNELCGIKPFRINFGQMENQGNGQAFVRAVDHALREAARRVEFGLMCSCVSEEACVKIRSQVVVNLGIRKESSRIDGGDRFSTVNSFNPEKTVDFLLDLAKDPFGGNRLDVSTVGSQLSAFNRWKGYYQLPLNQVLDELDNEVNVIDSVRHSKPKPNARGRPRKCKHLFDGGLSPSKKVRRLSELMLNGNESESDVEYTPKKRGRKRKANESNGLGEGSQSQTADEFLSQVYLAARNPIEGQHNLNSLVKFFYDFKNYQLRKNKNDEEIANQPETSETDMSIVTKSKEENSATSLTFKFTNLESVPPVKKLHEIFRRYGALQETETRVLKKKKCVKLVFERKCDAEAAFSSSGKYSIFGPALACYRLNFSPTLRKTGTAGKRG